MTFWSSQTLSDRLDSLVNGHSEFPIDCNSIQLRVGSEVYISPNLQEASSKTKKLLAVGEPFLIPPGQFAFLLTEEIVKVPVDAMAFISMKATFKLKGLVNVSGFHVDPGWQGPLIFGVFNAGPQSIHLQRGLPLFLIWYASLDLPSHAHKTAVAEQTIPPAIISGLSGGTDSYVELNQRLKLVEDKISTQTQHLKGAILLFLAIFALVAAPWVVPTAERVNTFLGATKR